MGSNLTPVEQTAILMIRTYQKFLSPMLGQHCRFYPSCSQYTLEAIKEWGLTKGIWLGTKRICRCHPLNPGGIDPVPRRFEYNDRTNSATEAVRTPDANLDSALSAAGSKQNIEASSTSSLMRASDAATKASELKTEYKTLKEHKLALEKEQPKQTKHENTAITPNPQDDKSKADKL